MDNQKKHKAHQKVELEKRNMFEEIYQSCEKHFSQQEFDFFIKCIIPQRAKINKTLISARKSENCQSTQDTETNIFEINQNILTMPRKAYFCGEKNIEGLKPEEKNRRLLTTPNDKVNRKIKFDIFDDFQFYKKMRRKEEMLTVWGKNREKDGKESLNEQEPLFLNKGTFNIPSTLLKFNEKSKTKKSKVGYSNHRSKTKNALSKYFNNEEFKEVPAYFLNEMKSANQSSEKFRTARLMCLKSVR